MITNSSLSVSLNMYTVGWGHDPTGQYQHCTMPKYTRKTTGIDKHSTDLQRFGGGSDPTAARGGAREGSEWQRSAKVKRPKGCEGLAGHRNRTMTPPYGVSFLFDKLKFTFFPHKKAADCESSLPRLFTYTAPLPVRTTRMVQRMTLISVSMLRSRMYFRSDSTHSSKSWLSLRPWHSW